MVISHICEDFCFVLVFFSFQKKKKEKKEEIVSLSFFGLCIISIRGFIRFWPLWALKSKEGYNSEGRILPN